MTKTTKTRNEVREMLINVMMNARGDKLTRDECLWLINNESQFDNDELGSMINKNAVAPFRQLISILNDPNS